MRLTPGLEEIMSKENKIKSRFSEFNRDAETFLVGTNKERQNTKLLVVADPPADSPHPLPHPIPLPTPHPSLLRQVLSWKI